VLRKQRKTTGRNHQDSSILNEIQFASFLPPLTISISLKTPKVRSLVSLAVKVNIQNSGCEFLFEEEYVLSNM
jgi:hypothetical protein